MDERRRHERRRPAGAPARESEARRERGKLREGSALEENSLIDVEQRLVDVYKRQRWASARNSWGLRFRRLDFTRFTALATLSLDRASFVATVRGNQGGRNVMEDDDLGERIAVAGRAPPSAEDLAREIQELERLEAPPWHVCCGHDAVAILSIGLRRALGSRNDAEVKETRLESMLRLAYDRDHFRRTNLYTAIRAWETANAPFTVF